MSSTSEILSPEEEVNERRGSSKRTKSGISSSDLLINKSASVRPPSIAQILTDDALQFVGTLHRRFNKERLQLLEARKMRQLALDRGDQYDFLPETRGLRESAWTVASCPADLSDRRVEITGPVEAKMIINALQSGAQVFMADFEDSLSPTWMNVIEGQSHLKKAIRRELSLMTAEGKSYELDQSKRLATLVVRPRGWHLPEKNIVIDGDPISAALFDFGIYFFHNAKELLSRKTGPYFYLPKLEHHLEARLWAQVFEFAEKSVGVPVGSIRATVLIETLPAAFQMDEILYELKNYAAGLNAGRWDYLFSIIKKLQKQMLKPLPDRSELTMTTPFMRAYAKRLVSVCHRRGAHAMGGMAAFIPSRKDASINAQALARVEADKIREASDGFDGTWVAHPDLVAVARKVFDDVLQDRPHQKNKIPEGLVAATDLLRFEFEKTGAQVTEAGIRNNLSVALQYLSAWLLGNGAVGIFNLMEDAATAEIARAQLWQWLQLRTPILTPEIYQKWKAEEEAKLTSSVDQEALQKASKILDELVLSDYFEEFLTLKTYAMIS